LTHLIGKNPAAALLFCSLFLATSPHQAAAFSAKNLEALITTNRCQECDLAGADLAGRDLSRASLTGANLSGANLSNANLSGAMLKDAKMAGANLSGAKTKGAKGLDEKKKK
jgi:uncharacterized protein YjbI with pentapeptide repeats